MALVSRGVYRVLQELWFILLYITVDRRVLLHGVEQAIKAIALPSSVVELFALFGIEGGCDRSLC